MIQSAGLDSNWLLGCAAFGILVLVGLQLRAGAYVRSKNNAEAVAALFIAVLAAIISFWISGWSILTSQDEIGFLPFPSSLTYSGRTGEPAFFVFGAMLAALAAASIAATSFERLQRFVTPALALMVGGLVLPLASYWTGSGFLARAGFVDPAGLLTMHLVIGFGGLGLVLVAGPRQGAFGGDPFSVPTFAPPMLGVGTVMLFLGWLGLRATALGGDGVRIAELVTHVLLAAAAAGLVLSFLLTRRRAIVAIKDAINGAVASGLLAALLSEVASPSVAILSGLIGAAFAVGIRRLLTSLEIDDSLGIVQIHAGPAIWGAVQLALTAHGPLARDGHGPEARLLVELGGAAIVAAFSFLAVGGLAYAFRRGGGLRVSPDIEQRGFNSAVFGFRSDMAILLGRIGLYRATADIAELVDLREGEIARMARDYNHSVERFRNAFRRARRGLDVAEDPTPMPPTRLRALEHEEDELKITAEEVNLVADQVNNALPLLVAPARPREAMLRMLHGAFEAPIRDLADLERRIRVEQDFDTIEAAIETARERSAQLARRLSTLVEFADVITAHALPRRTRVDLRDLLGELARDLGPRAQAMNILLAYSIEDGLEPVSAHAASLRKIMNKLLDNAIRFNQDGGIVEISASRHQQDAVRIVVSDTGSGMTAEQLRRIHQPFAAADSNPGAGLMLSLIDRLIALHGGRLEVTSKTGIGTRFEILLPTDAGAPVTKAG